MASLHPQQLLTSEHSMQDINPFFYHRSNTSPPQSAAAHGGLLSNSNNNNNNSNNGRKRSRVDSGSDHSYPTSTPQNTWCGNARQPQLAWSEDMASPAPFVDTRYALAPGMETPNQQRATDDDGNYTDVDFRRRWSGTIWSQEIDNSPKSPARSVTVGGLGQLVFNFVGNITGAAGKIIQFCKAGTFKGFYAGGGKGYAVNPPAEPYTAEESPWEELDGHNPFENPSRSPLPGRFPEDERFLTQEEATPSRPSKRLHTEQGAEWVMVGPRDTHTPRPSTPRLSGRPLPLKSGIPRPVTPGYRKPGVRSSLLPVSRRSSLLGSGGSAAVQHRQTANAATPRSREYSRDSYGAAVLSPAKTGTPLSAEAQKFAARMRREEREADESMRRFNAQLQAMIREGQQALGSKVEVEGDFDDY